MPDITPPQPLADDHQPSQETSTPDGNTTRERLLARAQKLIQQGGTQGFSYQQLANDIGIRKASVYYHFPSKEALINAVLTRYIDTFNHFLNQQEGITAEAQLHAYCHYFVQILSQHNQLCPVIMLTLEQNSLNDSTLSLMHEFLKRNEQWLTQVFRQGKSTRQLMLTGSETVHAKQLLQRYRAVC
ncbi:hypothetical protein BFW38_12265 [Terasakiispira papahanaumokuakeensis]|uniref:HTH tetR-type domain-containing protein n=1 Tax=Terasakiispira papahanaumokuakeensis TaxID=197479 RepID=A0A1E2VB21_9GAMM|nr:TetR/AcrR family transcriptional regulator [Terasakiispira papahanaumokuakeensis]ODC04187.1 hypothetical protein BFW38_12265 [Terasakiispira papahanaumokuakeensis]